MLTSPTRQPDVAVAHAVGVLDVFIAMGSRDFHELCQWQAERVRPICGRAVDLDYRHVFLYEDGHVEVEPIDDLRPPGQLVTPGGLLLKLRETGHFDWELEPPSRLGPLLEYQRQDILARGVEAITLSGSDPVGGYNPTEAVMAAYFAGLRYPHIDDRLLELEKSRIRGSYPAAEALADEVVRLAPDEELGDVVAYDLAGLACGIQTRLI